MTKDIPAGSGQLDPETAAKLGLQITRGKEAAQWGTAAQGERLKDYALLEVYTALESMLKLLEGE